MKGENQRLHSVNYFLYHEFYSTACFWEHKCFWVSCQVQAAPSSSALLLPSTPELLRQSVTPMLHQLHQLRLNIVKVQASPPSPHLSLCCSSLNTSSPSQVLRTSLSTFQPLRAHFLPPVTWLLCPYRCYIRVSEWGDFKSNVLLFMCLGGSQREHENMDSSLLSLTNVLKQKLT